jgi:short-subunit dehydrogenase
MQPKDLDGKVIVITGASSGIGEATAYELGASGAMLVLAARRKSRLQKVANKIGHQGGRVLVVDTDVSIAWQCKRLIKRAIKEFGHIDVLFNNAGWGSYAWFEEAKLDHIKEQFAVNVFGAIHLIHEVMPIMMKQRSGHIVNMVSYASRIAVPPMTVYASTKYALEGLTDALRRELLPWRVRVSRVHPSGVTGTEYNKKASQRGGLTVKSPGIGHVSKKFVARKIHQLILHPRPELMIGRLYDVPAFFNRYFPGLVDLVMKIYVTSRRKRDLAKKKLPKSLNPPE